MSSTSSASNGTTTAVTLASLSAQIAQTHTLVAALFAIIVILLVSGLAIFLWTCIKNRNVNTINGDDTERGIPLTTMNAGNNRGIDSTTGPSPYSAPVASPHPAPRRPIHHGFVEVPLRGAPSAADAQRSSRSQPLKSFGAQSFGADYSRGGRGARHNDDHSHDRHDNSMGVDAGRRLDRITMPKGFHRLTPGEWAVPQDRIESIKYKGSLTQNSSSKPLMQ